jgi:hypothetical protein
MTASIALQLDREPPSDPHHARHPVRILSSIIRAKTRGSTPFGIAVFAFVVALTGTSLLNFLSTVLSDRVYVVFGIVGLGIVLTDSDAVQPVQKEIFGMACHETW